MTGNRAPVGVTYPDLNRFFGGQRRPDADSRAWALPAAAPVALVPPEVVCASQKCPKQVVSQLN
jgi:hypothetical protein